MEAIVIATSEPRQLVNKLTTQAGYTIPVLLDTDGKIAIAYNPGIMPELKPNEVAIAANLIIDPDGKIQFFSLLDSKNFDARLVGLKKRLDALLAERPVGKSGT